MKDDVETMKTRTKSILITFMLLATLLLVTACSNSNTPYDANDDAGYTVSVRYDANGGQFTTSTSVIVDSYNISDMATNANGKVELGLLAPDDAVRGTGNYFAPVKNGYFLAGWYTERTETGKDANGNPVYTYANKWDFSKDTLEVDPGEEYSSKEPVVTLYAAWVELFQINFISINDGQSIGTYTFNPTEVKEIKVPEWGEDGAMQMYKFPSKLGYTYEASYYDKEATKLVEGTVTHSGKVSESTGTAVNTKMDLYVDLMEGEWYHIYNVEQFKKHAAITGSYILHADLDFEGQVWPSSLMYGNYTGTIQGNGYTISNVNFVQTNNSKTNAGMFGMLGAGSKITDVTFENITFTIEAGTRTAGTTFGLLAGTISADAQIANVKILNSTLQVDAGEVYFGTDDYAIGKVCGVGYTDVIDFSGITCKVIGAEDKLTILENEDENEIVLKFAEN